MNGRIAETDIDLAGISELDQLEAHVQCRLNGRVRDLRLLLRGQGLILKGHTRTYYAKQIAQHAVMDATELPIASNPCAMMSGVSSCISRKRWL